jgi:UDP-N-acetylmuramoyl-tripeptide--D-alanyl-D-alanine ligase
VREWPPIVSDMPATTARPVAFSAESLAAAVDGQLLRSSGRPIRGAAVDSRRVEPANAFFALPGERTDGHLFLADAVAHGAAALVVTRRPDEAELQSLTGSDAAVVQVVDAVAALGAAAAAWRARFSPLVVGVTGSLAKTSTKEQTAEVLGTRWKVLRNAGNENNEIGLPLTLLRLAPEHEAAVLEMGMYVPGDIAFLAALAQPSIGVVTAVRAAHLERSGSIEAIWHAKQELVEALPDGGTAVLNADDERVMAMAGSAAGGVRVTSYGFADAADVRAEHVTSLAEKGMLFELRAVGDAVDVTIPALGRHSVHNALAAAAVGLAAGFDLAAIARGLARPFSVPHRNALLEIGEWLVLDDSYNAAPDSMAAALDLLVELPGRHVAVLGEMLELGEAADAAHRDVGAHAARCAELLVAIGPRAASYSAAARGAGMAGDAVVEVADREAALAALLARLQPGDTVLFKASRGAALDLLIDALRVASGAGAAA